MGSIFIISSDPHLRKNIKNIVAPNGYRVVGESSDGMNSLRLLRTLSPDIILLDADLRGANSLEIAKIIAEDRIAPILLISSTWSGEMVHKARSTWIFAFALKPISTANLLPSVESAITSFTHLLRAEQKVDELEKALEARKIIEQAKGLLMDHMKISESEAYKRLRKQSMNKKVPLLDIANAVILLYKS